MKVWSVVIVVESGPLPSQDGTHVWALAGVAISIANAAAHTILPHLVKASPQSNILSISMFQFCQRSESLALQRRRNVGVGITARLRWNTCVTRHSWFCRRIDQSALDTGDPCVRSESLRSR